jgi:hypothetical protein
MSDQCLDAFPIKGTFPLRWTCPAKQNGILCPYAEGPGKEDSGKIDCPVGSVA